MNRLRKVGLYVGLPTAALLSVIALVGACGSQTQNQGGGSGGSTVAQLMRARNLTEQDVTAALSTYTPTGRHDEFYMFASGGHGGNVIVIGIPSMRILKYIAAFTPEPWQGYGFDEQTQGVLAGGRRAGHDITWGDMHHPALSETNGSYDGQFLFVGDKANARLAVVNLQDFVTTQIVTSELIQSDHGAAFVTPNTDYVVETTQYPAPLGGRYADVSRFNDEYRGAAIFWKFDRQHGRIDQAQSFAVEFPPYVQDLSDMGKRESDGFAFFNSINTERAYGGNAEGRPPMEAGMSQNDMDYLHVVNWRHAAEVAAQPGKTETIAGMRVIRLATAISEDILHFIPEPKSPHGADVSPDGVSIVVGGKLDTHATVYDIHKIKQLIAARRYEGHDPYGVPILSFRDSIRGQIELGLGPLHTQFDNHGNAYTSLFLETKVAAWSLTTLKLLGKVSTHYNIGHLSAVEGDTVSPGGHWLVAMNKWALDRYSPLGPLLPQNFQLVDISDPANMRVVYDMPIPLGEPHYAQIIRADRLHPLEVYPPGEDPIRRGTSPNVVHGGQERVERRPDGVHIYMTAVRSHFTPDTLRVRQGETVHLHIDNVEQAQDATHGLAIGSYNINLSLEPGEHADVTFVADRAGVFPLYCTEFCSALHLEMAGYLLVEPPGDATAQPAPAAPAAAPAPEAAAH